jgi:repressor LexA
LATIEELTMEELTPRQQKVLDFIASHLGKRGYPPTLREIAAHLAINGTLGVIKHLDALERKGFITKSAGSSRGIALVNTAAAAPIPIVGVVRAGVPQPAREEIEGYFAVDRSLLKGSDNFFLRVKGDSMIEAGIREGDLALVRPQPQADNGDIVVALLEGEATLKRFFKEKNRIRLQPENSAMEPIIVKATASEVSIIGKVTGIFRSLER